LNKSVCMEALGS